MCSAWEDPNTTWAFFGTGPSYAAHSRDDEGHFLITKGGHIANRAGGAGHNDDCFYNGGSLIFNVITIYHPELSVTGAASVKVMDHVIKYDGDIAKWMSDAAGDTGMLMSGSTRVLLRGLAPGPARITKRGGAGHDRRPPDDRGIWRDSARLRSSVRGGAQTSVTGD